jgi:hypothetical protein
MNLLSGISTHAVRILVRFKVLMKVTVKFTVFWALTSYNFIDSSNVLQECALPSSRLKDFYATDGGSTFLRNIGIYLPDYMESRPEI